MKRLVVAFAVLYVVTVAVATKMYNDKPELILEIHQGCTQQM